MSETLWTEEELASALGAPSAPLRADVGGVSIDTRTLQAGDLFIAIKGDVHDGHDHAARAFEAGAAAVVADATRSGELKAHGPVFAVDDTLRAMERLGVLWLPKTNQSRFTSQLLNLSPNLNLSQNLSLNHPKWLRCDQKRQPR